MSDDTHYFIPVEKRCMIKGCRSKVGWLHSAVIDGQTRTMYICDWHFSNIREELKAKDVEVHVARKKV